MPEFRNVPDMPPPGFPGSHMVIDAPYIHVSGLVATDVEPGFAGHGDIRAETEKVLSALDHMLASAGSGLAHVVRVDVHLADLADIDALDAIYAGFFTEGRYPARTCTESPHICGGCRVEITVMARLP